jgi:hypothetical protein
MKKLHIQKSISWCEKHDISSVKLYSSNNIFLSNIYEDGTPISLLKNNNNAFLKNKSSNFINNMYVGAGSSGSGVYNKNKVNIQTEPVDNTTNDIISDVQDVQDVQETSNTNNSE